MARTRTTHNAMLALNQAPHRKSYATASIRGFLSDNDELLLLQDGATHPGTFHRAGRVRLLTYPALELRCAR